MNLDAEHLGIPETDYAAVVKMPSSEFQRVIRDLSQFGDSLVISVTKVRYKHKAELSLSKNKVKKSKAFLFTAHLWLNVLFLSLTIKIN